MTTLIQGRSPPAARGGTTTTLSAGWRSIAALLASLGRAWEARQASVALWQMGPEMLRDIGIEPCEIDWVVRHGRADRSALRSTRDLGD